MEYEYFLLFLHSQREVFFDVKIIEINLNNIIELCRKFRVKTLAVFGSVLTNRFTKDSDIDLLVDFESPANGNWDYVDNYFGLRNALEALLGRRIDLIEEGGIRNPLFRKAIDNQKQMIYG